MKPPTSMMFQPVEMLIGGIRTVIIDPHNEIMTYWFEEFLKQKRSLIAVRIDAHHDMFHCCPALPAREGRESHRFLERMMPYINHYSHSMVNEGNFTCPAFHYGVIGALYHYHPAMERLDSYGRICGSQTQNAPKTLSKNAGSRGRWIFWDAQETRLNGDEKSPKTAPLPRRLSLDDIVRDMRNCQLPIILGVDLDGLYGNDDRGCPEEIIKRRLRSVKRLLERIRRPALICVARSQTPRSYVPPKAVDMVQDATLGLISALYG